MPGSVASSCHLCHLHNHHGPESLLRTSPLKDSRKKHNKQHAHFSKHLHSPGYGNTSDGHHLTASSSALARLSNHSHSLPGSRSSSYNRYAGGVSVVPTGHEITTNFPSHLDTHGLNHHIASSLSRGLSGSHTRINAEPDILVNAMPPRSRANSFSGSTSRGALGLSQDNSQDYYLHIHKQRFNDLKLKKSRFKLQTALLIGCYSLLLVAAIAVSVVVCYQNGWLGFSSPSQNINVEDGKLANLSETDLNEGSTSNSIASPKVNQDKRFTTTEPPPVPSVQSAGFFPSRNVQSSGSQRDIFANTDVNHHNQQGGRNIPTHHNHPQTVVHSRKPANAGPVEIPDDMLQDSSRNPSIESVHSPQHTVRTHENSAHINQETVSPVVTSDVENVDNNQPRYTIRLKEGIPPIRVYSVPTISGGSKFVSSLGNTDNVQQFHNNQHGDHASSISHQSPLDHSNAGIRTPNTQQTNQVPSDSNNSGQTITLRLPISKLNSLQGSPSSTHSGDFSSNPQSSRSSSSQINTPQFKTELVQRNPQLTVIPKEPSPVAVVSAPLIPQDGLTTQELIDLLALRRMRDLLNSHGGSDSLLNLLRNVQPSDHIRLDDIRSEDLGSQQPSPGGKNAEKSISSSSSNSQNSKTSTPDGGVSQKISQEPFVTTLLPVGNVPVIRQEASVKPAIKLPVLKSVQPDVSIRHQENSHRTRVQLQPSDLGTVLRPVNRDPTERISVVESPFNEPDNLNLGPVIPENFGNNQNRFTEQINSGLIQTADGRVDEASLNTFVNDLVAKILKGQLDGQEVPDVVPETIPTPQETDNTLLPSFEEINEMIARLSEHEAVQEELQASAKPTSPEDDMLSFIADLQVEVPMTPEMRWKSRPDDVSTITLEELPALREAAELEDSPRIRKVHGQPIATVQQKDSQPFSVNLRTTNEKLRILSPNDDLSFDAQAEQGHTSDGIPLPKKKFVPMQMSKLREILSELGSPGPLATQEDLDEFRRTRLEALQEAVESPKSETDAFFGVNRGGKAFADDDAIENLLTQFQQEILANRPSPIATTSKQNQLNAQIPEESSSRSELPDSKHIVNKPGAKITIKEPSEAERSDKNTAIRLQEHSPQITIKQKESPTSAIPAVKITNVDLPKTSIKIPTETNVPAIRLLEKKEKPTIRLVEEDPTHSIKLRNNIVRSPFESRRLDTSGVPNEAKPQLDVLDSQFGFPFNNAERLLPGNGPDPTFSVLIKTGGGKSLDSNNPPARIEAPTNEEPFTELVEVKPGEQAVNAAVIRAWTHMDSAGTFSRGQVRSDGSFAFTNCRPVAACGNKQ